MTQTTVRCTDCGQAIRIPRTALGRFMVCPRCQVTFLADVEGEDGHDEIAHERKFEPLPLTQRPFSQQKPSVSRVRHPKKDLLVSYRFWGGVASLVLAVVAGFAVYFLIVVPAIEYEKLRIEEERGLPDYEEYEFEIEEYRTVN